MDVLKVLFSYRLEPSSSIWIEKYNLIPLIFDDAKDVLGAEKKYRIAVKGGPDSADSKKVRNEILRAMASNLNLNIDTSNETLSKALYQEKK